MRSMKLAFDLHWLGWPTLAQQASCLCINVQLLCINVAKDNPMTVLFPPSSDFNLVGKNAAPPRLISCTLSCRMSAKAGFLSLNGDLNELLCLKDMTPEVIPTVGLQAVGRLVI